MSGRTYKILVVDDDAVIRSSFEALLNHLGYDVISVDDGEKGFHHCKTDPDIDLVFMDLYMPNISGFESINLIKSIRDDLPIIIITGESTVENAMEAIKAGAYDFVPKPVTNYKILDIIIRRALEYRNSILREKQYKTDLKVEIQKKTDQLLVKNRQLEENVKNLENLSVEVISSFMEMMEQKDPYLTGHTNNVVKYSVAFGRLLHLSPRELATLENAAKLHDIGKIVISDSILEKKDTYTDEEWFDIKQHPNLGAAILRPLEFLGEVREIILQHHERYDGRGYPQGLKGEEINYFARILMIVNSYDAMTSRRSHKSPLGRLDAIMELENNKGTQFDPELAELFIQWLRVN